MDTDAVLIAGPTASGKSAFALELAEKLNGTIINTDSMQVYPKLRILTARPGNDEIARAPHVLYGHASLLESYSVSRWLEDVRVVLDDVASAGRVPIFVGGTGLYFKALTEGLVIIPDILPAIRNFWRNKLEDEGLAILFDELRRRDPQAADVLSANDRQRIVRALEVVDATGQSILEHQSSANAAAILDTAKAKKFILSPERKILHGRIEKRFDWMIEAGALEEVDALLKLDVHPDHPVMKAIGIPQLRQYIRGETTLQTATEKCKIATRQYAKRQTTWFRNQLSDDWVMVA